MDHQEGDHFHRAKTRSFRLALGRLNRNDQISEEMGMEVWKLALPHRESEDIGRFVPAKVPAVQFLNLDIIDQQEAEFSVKKPQVGQYPLGRPSYFF